jgi:hypothetical protein
MENLRQRGFFKALAAANRPKKIQKFSLTPLESWYYLWRAGNFDTRRVPKQDDIESP